MEEKQYLAAIGEFHGISSEVWQKLTSYFKNYRSAWEATTSDLKSSGLSEKQIMDFAEYRRDVDPEAVWVKYQKLGIDIVPLTSPSYPTVLKEIFNPPFLLYIRGKLTLQDDVAVAVVGSRKATDYGRRATAEIAGGVAAAGVTIVSGLALGLDAEAHAAALKAGGRTIAVLAGGLDDISPHTNYALGLQILKSGAIISEKPFGMPPLRQNFPARNRIISGLSQGVLVTEAGEHSGTLHTANFALEQNRQIYAIPGPIYNPLAMGPNDLLKVGAKAVTKAEDILEDLGIDAQVQQNIRPENQNEEVVFAILDLEPKHIDAITAESGREAHEVSQILTMMEIKGKVRHLGGMVYSLRK